VYPATLTLGDEIGMSERQACDYIQELERGKFIEVDRDNKHYRKNGSGGTNTFFFSLARGIRRRSRRAAQGPTTPAVYRRGTPAVYRSPHPYSKLPTKRVS
jgi:hypothetical protein